MSREYEVTWGMVYEATSHADAVRQALADLDHMSKFPSEGPNTFLSRLTVDAPVEENYFQFAADEALALADLED